MLSQDDRAAQGDGERGRPDDRTTDRRCEDEPSTTRSPRPTPAPPAPHWPPGTRTGGGTLPADLFAPTDGGSVPSLEYSIDSYAVACAHLLNAKCEYFTMPPSDGSDPSAHGRDETNPSLAALMMFEQRYAAATDEREERLVQLSIDASFAELACTSCRRLHRESSGPERPTNFTIGVEVAKAHYRRRIFAGPPDRVGAMPLRGGGLRLVLWETVLPLAQEWCANVHAQIVHLMTRTRSHGDTHCLLDEEAKQIVEHSSSKAVVTRLAEMITERALLCGGEDDEDDEDDEDGEGKGYGKGSGTDATERLDPLSTHALEELCVKCTTLGEGGRDRVKDDLDVLELLERMVETRSLPEVYDLLDTESDRLERALLSLPVELRDGDVWERHCAPHMIHRAANARFHRELCANIILQWVLKYGNSAKIALKRAKERLRSWVPLETPFLLTVAPLSGKAVRCGACDASTICASAATPAATPGATPAARPALPVSASARSGMGQTTRTIPTPLHVSLQRRYTYRLGFEGDRMRSGLDTLAEAAVRLVSVVWELAGRWGEFPSGVLQSGVVSDVSMHCAIESGLVHDTLQRTILSEGLHIGPTLRAVCDQMMDGTGEHATHVAHASHALCSFSSDTLCKLLEPLSMDDRETSRSERMVQFFHAVGQRMRPLLCVSPGDARFDVPKVPFLPSDSHQQFAFVYDTHLLVTAAVLNMRSRAAVPPRSKMHPAVSGLLSLSDVRAWSPGDGPISVSRAEFLRLPPDTRMWITALVNLRGDAKPKFGGKSLCFRRHNRRSVDGEYAVVIADPHLLLRMAVSRFVPNVLT